MAGMNRNVSNQNKWKRKCKAVSPVFYCKNKFWFDHEHYREKMKKKNGFVEQNAVNIPRRKNTHTTSKEFDKLSKVVNYCNENNCEEKIK